MLPLVLPPTVLGYYLLQLLGRRSPLGYWLEQTSGITFVFHWSGAVVASAVAAFPLFLLPARGAFEAIDPALEDVARLLGRGEFSVFFAVTLPLAWRGLAAGIVLAFARALGDFGATLMVAGNIPGLTQTAALAIYDAVQVNDGPAPAGSRSGFPRCRSWRFWSFSGRCRHEDTHGERFAPRDSECSRGPPGPSRAGRSMSRFQLGREIGVVFGPSGAGKTTLLRLIAGLTTPDSGAFGSTARRSSTPDSGESATSTRDGSA